MEGELEDGAEAGLLLDAWPCAVRVVDRDDDIRRPDEKSALDAAAIRHMDLHDPQWSRSRTDIAPLCKLGWSRENRRQRRARRAPPGERPRRDLLRRSEAAPGSPPESASHGNG